MNKNFALLPSTVLIAAATAASRLTALGDHAPRDVLPDAIVDLRTTEGVSRVKAQWRYRDTRISEIDHRGVGPDLKASGLRRSRSLRFAELKIRRGIGD